MGIAARETETKVMNILRAGGANILRKGQDGGGRSTVTFELHGTEKTFHYARNHNDRGCGSRNMATRLRSILKSIVPQAPTRVASVPTTKAQATELPANLRRPTPPRTRVTRADRAKRYIAIRSLDKLSAETKMSKAKLYDEMIAVGGQASELARQERNRTRSAARIAKAAPPPSKAAKPAPTPTPAAKRPRPVGAAKIKRDLQITRAIYNYKTPAAEVAERHGLSVATIQQIAHKNYPLLTKKAA